MASIRKRIPKGCVTESVQIQIRRAGVRYFCLSFNTYEEAKSWVDEHEELYIANPDIYHEKYDHTNELIRRKLLREREFSKNCEEVSPFYFDV